MQADDHLGASAQPRILDNVRRDWCLLGDRVMQSAGRTRVRPAADWSVGRSACSRPRRRDSGGTAGCAAL